MARFWNSLRCRLLLLVILGIVPPIALIVHSGLEQRQLASVHAQEKVRALAEEVSRDHGIAVDITAGILRQLAEDSSIKGLDPSAVSRRIDVLFENLPFPFYANIGLIDPLGNVVCSAVKRTGPVNVADRLYFKQAMSSRGFSQGSYQVGLITGKKSINFGYPVLDDKGEVRAVLFAALDLAWFTRIASEMDIPDEISLTLIDAHGTVLYRKPDSERWVGHLASEVEIVKTILERGKGVKLAEGMDGTLKLYAFRPLGRLPHTGYVYAGIPIRAVASKANRSLIRNLGLLGLAAVVGLLAVWFISYLFIMRPLNALVIASQQIAAGHLDARTGLDVRVGEIGQVGSAFDRMAETVQRREAEMIRTNRELDREKSLLDMTLDGLPGIFYLFDSNGKLLRWNKELEITGGYSGSEISLMHPLDFIAPDDRKKVREAIEQTLTGGEAFVEARFLSKEGRELWNLFTGKRIELEGKPCLVGMGIDITARRDIEIALRESEQMFKLLSEQSLMSVAILQDGVYRYANDAMAHLLECPLDEILAWQPEEFLMVVHPDDRSLVLEQARKKQEGLPGQEPYYSFRVLTKRGAVKWVDIYSKTIQFRGRPANLLTVLDVTQRRKAEEALQSGELRYRTLFERARDAILIIDLEGDAAGRIVAANPRTAEMHGYDQEELLSLRISDLNTPESAEKDPDRIRRVLSGEWLRDESLHRRKDGTVFPVEISAGIMELEGHKYCLATDRDVTEHRRAEETLRQSEERYRIAALMTGQLIYDYDCVTGEIKWAGAIETITGYSEEEFSQINIREWEALIHPDDREPALGTLRESMQQAALYAVQYRFQKKSREYVWVEDTGSFLVGDDGKPIRMLGAMKDVTEKRLTLEALAEREQTLRSILSASPVAITFVEDGLVRWTNPAMLRMFGIDTEEESVGADVRDFYSSKEDYQRVLGLFKDSIGSGVLLETEARFVRRDGSCFLGELRIAPIRVPSGKRGLISAIMDISARVRAEEELRAGEEKYRHLYEESKRQHELYRSLLDSSADAVVVYDMEGYAKYVNEAFTRTFGWTMEEIRDQRIPYLPDSERDESSALISMVVRDGDPCSGFETKRSTKDGRVLDISLSASCYHDHEGAPAGMLVVLSDISQRKKAEAQIKLNEARLRSLYDISQHAAETTQELLDFALGEAIHLTGSKVGYIYYYDEEKQIFELNTWSREVMKECEVVEPRICYELTNAGIWGEAVRQRQAIVVNDFHAPNPLKKGYPKGHVQLRNFMTVPVSSGERIVAVVGAANKESDYDESDVRQLTLLMDSVWRIAEAKRSELEHRRSATALECAAEGVIITDLEGTIQYVNPSLERMTGYSKSELVGNNPRMLKSGEQNNAFYEELWGTIKGGMVWTGRFVNKRKDGTIYTEDATISPVRDASGAITSFVGMKKDVTEHLALSKQLLHARKMEAIGTLAGGIAHDFNNLLQIILGCTDLLLMTKVEQDADRKKLELIDRAARDGAELVSRILTFGRRSEPRTRAINLNEEIGRVEKLLRRTLPRMIQIQLRLADDIRTIDADPAQIEQVLLNLGVNAQHAMPDGGRLVIETGDVRLDEEYARAHVESKSGDHVLLTVSDTGVGMTPEVMDRIFEPFFTTKTGGEGTGLGLAMVHGIIKQHGAHIRCYSELGVGTSFWMYFPVSESELVSDVHLTREMPGFGTETILLADDDVSVRETAREMIEMVGYRVLTAGSGEEALATYAAMGHEIDLVILDLIMPGMGGKRCLEELLRIDPNVRVIVASGFSANAVDRDRLGNTASDFVSKPYDMKGILGAIRKVLDQGRP
ncbi:MAG: PAS domain S-box protein [Pseudomonadota bacterium]